MSEITIERPDRANLESMGVFGWPIWEKEASTFPWEYGDRETCLVLEGKARVEPEDGTPVEWLSRTIKILDPFYISTPSRIFERFFELSNPALEITLGERIYSTVTHTLGGFVVGVSTGFLAGLYLGRDRYLAAIDNMELADRAAAVVVIKEGNYPFCVEGIHNE